MDAALTDYQVGPGDEVDDHANQSEHQHTDGERKQQTGAHREVDLTQNTHGPVVYALSKPTLF